MRTGPVICTVWFFPDWINYKYWTISIKIHLTSFVYYYTILPIIPTGWKISLHLQIYVQVNLKNMNGNFYKTSSYNRNLRVILGFFTTFISIITLWSRSSFVGNWTWYHFVQILHKKLLRLPYYKISSPVPCSC